MSALASSVQVVAAENPLLKASPGLMIWTIVMFFLTLWILKRYVFGPLGAAIEKRRAQIQRSIDDAEASRDEAGPRAPEGIGTADGERGQGVAPGLRTEHGRRPTQEELASGLDVAVRSLQRFLRDHDLGWPLAD